MEKKATTDKKIVNDVNENDVLALGTDNRIQKLDAVRHFVLIMYKLSQYKKLYLRQDNDHIGSVLTSLDEQLASLDENNVIENETVDKKDVFIKKPFVAESPESREEMIKAEEWLQALVSLRLRLSVTQKFRENFKNGY